MRTSTVEYQRNTDSNHGGGGSYHAKVFYAYQVKGTAYSGDRVAYGDYGASNPSHAQDIVNRYPVGKRVPVYYMPDEPKECVLEPGLKAQAWIVPGMGMVFFSVGAAMAIFMPRAVAKTQPPAPVDRRDDLSPLAPSRPSPPGPDR